MTSVEFYIVIIAVNHVVSVHIGIAVDASVGFEVADAFNGIVEAVEIAADKVIVADDSRVIRLVKHDCLRTCRVAVKPAVGS
jgi:hypothetical protein